MIFVQLIEIISGGFPPPVTEFLSLSLWWCLMGGRLRTANASKQWCSLNVVVWSQLTSNHKWDSITKWFCSVVSYAPRHDYIHWITYLKCFKVADYWRYRKKIIKISYAGLKAIKVGNRHISVEFFFPPPGWLCCRGNRDWNTVSWSQLTRKSKYVEKQLVFLEDSRVVCLLCCTLLYICTEVRGIKLGC